MANGRACLVWSVALGLSGAWATPAAAQNVEALLGSYRPTQRDIEIETPPRDEWSKCKAEVQSKGKTPGFLVTGPAGQVLRRFIDTDGDGAVDQWRYYNLGMEVYRDIDTNKNNKPDQFRCVNFGGSRWGIDSNEDGKVDQWKQLSAAEASREAIQAMIHGDAASFRLLLITADDLRQLGVQRELATKILKACEEAAAAVESGSKSKLLSKGSRWIRFDAQTPGVIPSDDEKATADVMVYENAMAIVDVGGSTGLVQIGEMIRVGDVWKLTQAPQPIEGNEQIIAAGGILMQPLAMTSLPGGGTAPSPELQKLLEELQALDQKAPQPDASPDAFAQYNTRRADMMTRLYNASDTAEEKEQWLRQLIDGLAAAVQTGKYTDGLNRLRSIEGDLRKASPKSPLVSYTAFRVLQSSYFLEMARENDTDKRQELQKKWMESLAKFVQDNPQSEDLDDAMLNLAVTEEFNNRTKEATEWYQRLATSSSKTPAGQRAQGALRRLELKGKPISLSGPAVGGGTIDLAKFRGKAVLVTYWASNNQPFVEDLPELRQLYQQYKSRGFEIVGVCLDFDKQAVSSFLQQHKMTWPQIFEGGSLESPAAMQYGVVSLPTMFLVDAKGTVISRNTTVQELKALLAQQLAANKQQSPN